MNASFKKLFSFYIILAIVSPSLLGSVGADGGIFGKSDAIFYIEENTQYAVIHHINGVQKMIITVNFNWEESNKTAWIFPIPSDPEKVTIDIAVGAPVFYGFTDVVKEARDDLADVTNMFFASYITSVIMPMPLTMWFYSIESQMAGTAATGEIHKSLEKYGLTAEVISASEGLGIYQYLTENGLNISEGIVSQLDEYVEDDFSFVVTWVSNLYQTVRNPGIIVEFPTKDIFYPLYLTSIYGSETIPIDIMVVDHVSPKVYDEIEPYCEITYGHGYITRYFHESSPELDSFIRSIRNNWDNTFTRIEINAPANAFEKDLWIENKVPNKVQYAKTIHDTFGSNLGIFILLYLIFSVTLALVFGMLVLGRDSKDIPFYFIIGIGNIIGIIGVLVFFAVIKRIYYKSKEFPSNRVALFLVLYILTFIIIMWLLFTILMMPLL